MMGDASPTRVRYGVIAACSLMGVLLYLHRFCVSFAEAYIKEDLGLSATEISLLFGVFFFSYALGQTPSGWLADRFGGRRMLTIFILTWSLVTGLMGLATGIGLLIALRLGSGLAQAGAFPTAASLISKWVPLTQRGIASSIVALGGRIGGALSLLITGYVILWFVPVSTSSLLTERDLLRGDRLCYQLVHGSRPPTRDEGEPAVAGRIGKRLVDTFPAPLREEVAVAAQNYQRLSRETKSDVGPPTDGSSAALRTSLAEALNVRISSPEPWVTLDELGDLRVEREAANYLRQDPSSWTGPQRERTYRLVLEALYPAAIKKVYGLGWRWMTLAYGLLGIPMGLWFWWVCRDDPPSHPRCNAAEQELIAQGRRSTSTAPVGGLPLRELATNTSMWFNGSMQFFTNVGWVFVVTYLPRYLLEVHGTPVAERAVLSTLPTVAGILGMFCGGFVADRLVVAWGRRWGRSLPIALTRFVAAGGYLLCLLHPSPWVAVGLMCVTVFFCDLGIPAVWAFQQDVGGRHAGSVLGWGNMWGNFGAAVGPYLLGQLIDKQLWDGLFLASAAAFLVSGFLGLGVDATCPVVAEPAPSEP